jgi:hypothetical protein
VANKPVAAIEEGIVVKDRIQLGFWHAMVGVPRALWRSAIDKNALQTRARVESLIGEEHRRVQHFCVRELPRAGKSLQPEEIAAGTGLPLERVQALLDDLEAGMTFLYRNPAGAVHWAYPVTADETPHRVTFSTGERIHAA